MSTHPSANVKMLYSLEGTLVGSRRKMRDEVSVSDLEYTDDMALMSDLVNALWKRRLSGCSTICVWGWT